MSDEEVADGMKCPEFLPSLKKTKYTFINGASPRLGWKRVEYTEIDGLAMFEGDIVLGTIEQIEKVQTARDIPTGAVSGVAITGSRYRWPNATIPYTIDSALPNQSRVTDAIQHIQQNTCLRFIERTSSNASQYSNYVNYFRGGGCWSYVGMQGNGKQDLSLANGCSLGNAIHETLHAAGLWHEQSREDRDNFVTINYANIIAGREHNFDQHISDGDDIGTYDYCSIMHYPANAFSKNGQPTIVPSQTTGSCTIGQRNGMSQGDISAIKTIYNCPNGGGSGGW